MDTFCSPNPAMSSVFLTPPISTERKYPELVITRNERIQIPDFLRLTPERPVAEDIGIDIVSLLAKPFPHLTSTILSYLAPSDLTSCLRVSKQWRSAVLSNKYLTGLVNQFRISFQIEKKEEQENIMKTNSMLFDGPPRTPRLPFHSLPTNFTRPKQTVLATPLPQIDQNIRLRPCPQCSSPAKILSDTMSQCCKCMYEFCPKCFKPNHADRNCTTLSPPRKRQDVIACNRKSKKRLRRL